MAGSYQQFLKSKFSDGLTEDQLRFFESFLDSSDNILLSGPAGTGKSFTISRLYEYCLANNILLSKTASTGIAAVNIEAQTIHSFLGIGLADCESSVLCRKVNRNKPAKERIQGCSILLIDEASMIAGETLDKIYDVLKSIKFKIPRIILCGDWLQLPPVFRENKLFAFESKSWDKLKFKPIILKQIVRQDAESDYAKFLQKIRVGDKSDLSFISSRMLDNPGKVPDGSLVVFSKNIDVDEYNSQKLRSLPGKSEYYYSDDAGSEPFISTIKKNCLAPEVLELKEGAQVMCLKNTTDGEVMNGMIGKVLRLTPEAVIVKFDFGNHSFSKDTWKMEESYFDSSGKVKTKLLASRTQIPLKLAFAGTVHKTQGITCDKIAVDLSDCFAPGQCYVALSRAKSAEGLSILNFSPSSIRVDAKCIDFYKNI